MAPRLATAAAAAAAAGLLLVALQSTPAAAFSPRPNKPTTGQWRMQAQQPDSGEAAAVSRAGAVLGQAGAALAGLAALGGLAAVRCCFFGGEVNWRGLIGWVYVSEFVGLGSCGAHVHFYAFMQVPLPAAAEQRALEYMPGIEGKGYGKPRQVRNKGPEKGLAVVRRCVDARTTHPNIPIYPLMACCLQVYKDFVQTPTGLQYKDVREGSGNSPGKGDRVVIDWEGYTVGYYGRIFEAKGKTKGGAFDAAVRTWGVDGLVGWLGAFGWTHLCTHTSSVPGQGPA